MGDFNVSSQKVRATDPFFSNPQTWATFGDARIEEWDKFGFFAKFLKKLPVFIEVCVMDQQRKILTNQSVDNDPEAVFRVVAPYGSKVYAAIEASTGVADFAEKLITQYKWHVELAHPGYVARMKQTPDKSDWTDAKLLADLTRVGYIPRVWLAPQYIRNLLDLIRHRSG